MIVIDPDCEPRELERASGRPGAIGVIALSSSRERVPQRGAASRCWSGFRRSTWPAWRCPCTVRSVLWPMPTVGTAGGYSAVIRTSNSARESFLNYIP